MSVEQTIKTYLEKLEIDFETLEHEPFFSVEETLGAYESMGLPENKSLFVRDEKKKRFYLVVIAGEKRADLKALAKRFNEKRLSFCSPPTLEQKLHTTPGAVSPFGLVFPEAEEVEVLFDQALLSGSHIGFHPNRNTQTWKMTTSDFKRFLDALPHKITYDTL